MESAYKAALRMRLRYGISLLVGAPIGTQFASIEDVCFLKSLRIQQNIRH